MTISGIPVIEPSLTPSFLYQTQYVSYNKSDYCPVFHVQVAICF